jgi:NDP-sugar pyrophosphorylase family protein
MGRLDRLQALSISPRPTTAVVLAGGFGTRLRAQVPDQPKVLALAAGQPFLHYQLTYLASQGIQQVILALGYKASQVQSFVGMGEHWNLTIECIVEESPLGTAGAARLASAGLTAPFFVFNGDTLFIIALDKLWAAHCQYAAAATIALRPISQSSQERSQRGVVALDSEGLIQEFSEKSSASQASVTGQSELTNGGVYVLTSAALQSVRPDQMVSLETQVFPALAKTRQLGGYVQDAYFADIGTPDSLAAFEVDLLAGRGIGF